MLLREKQRQKFIGTVLTALLLLVNACGTPERDNPYDPKSPRYRDTTVLEGTVVRFYPPFAPISSATVTLLPDSFSTKTDAAGRFQFPSVKVGSHRIAAAKEGFSGDTLNWEITLWGHQQPVLHLDALPRFEQVKIRTRHISRWWPPDDLYFLEIRVILTDADGPTDIAAAYFSFPDAAVADTLLPGDQMNEFSKTIEQRDLPLTSLQELIGRPLFLYANDRAGYSSTSGPYYITRIIEELATPDSPKGLETAPNPPVLHWIHSRGQYTYSYTAEIYRDDGGVVTRVWRQEGIPAATDSARVQQPLSTGIYFWTVSVVDRFGNTGRSKEAAFRIE